MSQVIGLKHLHLALPSLLVRTASQVLFSQLQQVKDVQNIANTLPIQDEIAGDLADLLNNITWLTAQTAKQNAALPRGTAKRSNFIGIRSGFIDLTQAYETMSVEQTKNHLMEDLASPF